MPRVCRRPTAAAGDVREMSRFRNELVTRLRPAPASGATAVAVRRAAAPSMTSRGSADMSECLTPARRV
jgi:hypothetical protein